MTMIDNETVKRVMAAFDRIDELVKTTPLGFAYEIQGVVAAARAALSTEPTEARAAVGCEVCAKLPKTADGVPVTPNMQVWTKAEEDKTVGLHKIISFDNSTAKVNDQRDGRTYVQWLSRIYSTRPRAAAALSTPNTQPSGGPKDGK